MHKFASREALSASLLVINYHIVMQHLILKTLRGINEWLYIKD